MRSSWLRIGTTAAAIVIVHARGAAWPAQEMTGASIASALEPIRQQHKLPALAGAILTSHGLTALGVTGVRKSGTTVAATADDLWHLGSDTKAMTAVVVATLVERGSLAWDRNIGDVFGSLASDFPAAFRSITVKQLLSHHAGLPANLNWRQIEQAGGASANVAKMRDQRLSALRTAAKTPLVSEPGTKYEYSNLGYTLAGAIAEHVTGKAWEDLVTEIVFAPLGMKSAGFGGLGTPGQIDQPWPHGADGKPMPLNGPNVDNAEVMGPAGTVHCSLADWARFVADQLSGERGAGALLKPETYKTLHTVAFDADYAFGWLVVERPWGGGLVMTHAGSNTMNYAVVWMAPARDFAVLVVTNQGGPEAQAAADQAAGALIRLKGDGSR
jgi:CubicO group peptidase (beta-lactamase class C family)